MDSNRRNFCKDAAVIALGGVAVAAPVGAGLCALLNPLRGDGESSQWVRVAELAAVPADHTPRKFAVVADQVDAWNRRPQVPIGAVYLRRKPGGQIEALNALCPHAGGFIDYVPAEKCFLCPLHKSRFNDEGAIQDPHSPAPRPMDSLAVEVRGGEVWVQYEDFRPGTARKIPA